MGKMCTGHIRKCSLLYMMEDGRGGGGFLQKENNEINCDSAQSPEWNYLHTKRKFKMSWLHGLNQNILILVTETEYV